MPRYTSAYSHLILRLREIEALRAMAGAVSSRAATTSSRHQQLKSVDALCRSGVVLLCSHVEGYIEDLGFLAIDRIESKEISKSAISESFKYHLSRDLIGDIKSATDPVIIASKVQELLSRDFHIWDARPNFSPPLSAPTFVENFSTPTYRNIRRFLRRFGYDQYQSDLANHLASYYQVCTNMIDQVVDQRNKIAHGDAITTATPSDLANMLQLVKLYCQTTDMVVGDWFRTIGCPIR